MTDDKTIIADIGSISVFQTGKRSKKKACLIQYSGAKLGVRYPLSENINIVGRSKTVQIFIAEASVSRQHAKFSLKGEDVVFEDMSSSNGSFVNDETVSNTKVTLKDGDMIRLGTVLLKYFAHNNVDNIIHDKIYQMATIDVGTGIYNRQFLLDALETEFSYAKDFDREFSIIFFDLDKFKFVNDTYGHNAGDYILREGASLVKPEIRKDDIYGRFGGEEFLVLLPKTALMEAVDMAERIRITYESHVFKIDLPEENKIIDHTQTVSLGVAQYNSKMQDVKELLESADKKLYDSKANGRNKVTY